MVEHGQRGWIGPLQVVHKKDQGQPSRQGHQRGANGIKEPPSLGSRVKGYRSGQIGEAFGKLWQQTTDFGQLSIAQV